MKSNYTAIKVKFKRKGCTDSTAINYDSKATIDDGSCIEKVFFNCVADKVLNATLKDCESNNANKALKVYSIYQSLEASIAEKNTFKVEKYKKKLAELCNAEYCETC
jgi:hypothetical protein